MPGADECCAKERGRGLEKRVWGVYFILSDHRKPDETTEQRPGAGEGASVWPSATGALQAEGSSCRAPRQEPALLTQQQLGVRAGGCASVVAPGRREQAQAFPKSCFPCFAACEGPSHAVG